MRRAVPPVLSLLLLVLGSGISSEIATSRNSVLRGAWLTIGDLARSSTALGDSEPLDPAMIRRCVAAGTPWIESSADGRTLILKSPFGRSEDVVASAFCDDTIVLLGGYREANGPRPRLAWIFSMGEGKGPTTIFPTKPFAVGGWPHETLFTLNEVRAIVPAEGRIVFVGSSESESGVALSAPYAVTPRKN